MENVTETTPATEISVDPKDVQRAISLLLEAEYSIYETEQSFIKRGHTQEEASTIVAIAVKLQHQYVQPKSKGNGVAQLVLGIVLLVVGIALTAADIGYIFYGAIVVGIVKIIQGIIAMNE